MGCCTVMRLGAIVHFGLSDQHHECLMAGIAYTLSGRVIFFIICKQYDKPLQLLNLTAKLRCHFCVGSSPQARIQDTHRSHRLFGCNAIIVSWAMVFQPLLSGFSRQVAVDSVYGLNNISVTRLACPKTWFSHQSMYLALSLVLLPFHGFIPSAEAPFCLTVSYSL